MKKATVRKIGNAYTVVDLPAEVEYKGEKYYSMGSVRGWYTSKESAIAAINASGEYVNVDDRHLIAPYWSDQGYNLEQIEKKLDSCRVWGGFSKRERREDYAKMMQELNAAGL